MRLTLRTDGGSRGNPGPSAAGIIISDAITDHKVFAGGFYLGEVTNNTAEYEAVLRGLQLAQQLGGSEVQIFCDSELLVKQFKGQYRVKNANLKQYHQKIMALRSEFARVTIQHVYREDNTEADAMVNESIDARSDVGGILADSKKGEKPSVQESLGKGEITETIELPGLVNFNENGTGHETFAQDQGLISELLCLEQGRNSHMNSRGKGGTITIMRGAGTITVGQSKRTVKAGTWLRLNGVDSVEFSADPDKQLVALVTWFDPERDRNDIS